MRLPRVLSPPKLLPALLLCSLVCLWQLSFLRLATPLATRIQQAPGFASHRADEWDLVWEESSMEPTRSGDSAWDFREGTALGMCADVRIFFPWFYYFGQLPVGAIGVGAQPHPFTDAAARALLARSGPLLRNDFSKPCNTARHGDLGKIFLLLPAAILSANPLPPSVLPATALLFVAGLCAVLIGFWRTGYPLLGLLIVLFAGSNPFQLFEVYSRENVFSLPISTALLVLGTHVRYLTDSARIDRGAWLTAAATGVFLASVREVRADSALIGLAVVPVYLSIRGSSWRRRLALALLFAASAAATAQLWDGWFDRKYRDAQQFVRSHGGTPYTGPHDRHHAIWHNLFTGLGDFDTRKGYSWDDRAAYAFAAPILRSRYGLPYTYTSGFYFDESYDGEGLYRVSPQDLPQYTDVIRDKVLGDVAGDPGWYLGILGRRLLAILSRTTPIGVGFGSGWMGTPFPGWLVVPTLIGVAIARKRFLAGLLLFSFPLCLSPLLVFCGPGSTYYAIYHLLTLGVWLELLAEAFGLQPIIATASISTSSSGTASAETTT